VRGASIFLPILSRAYLNSAWCRKELDWFLDEVKRGRKPGSSVFLVEYEPVRRPPNLGALGIAGYPFWVEDPESGAPLTLGAPEAQKFDWPMLYEKRLHALSYDLASELERARDREQAHGDTDTTVSPPRPIATKGELARFVTTLQMIEMNNFQRSVPAKLADFSDYRPEQVEALFGELLRLVEAKPE
jgi:hypothetical protein